MITVGIAEPKANNNELSSSQSSQSSSNDLAFDLLLKILGKKTYKTQQSGDLIEMILQTMAENEQYKDDVVKKIKNQTSQSTKILESKHDKLNIMVREMWRTTMAIKMKKDVSSIYEYSKCQKIEDKINETNMERIRLPLISTKCIAQSGDIDQNEE